MTPPPDPPQPGPALLPMDGRLMDLPAFRAHLLTADLAWVRRVVIHHTAAPDVADWVRWGGWPYWKSRLQAHYSGLGWRAMPHLFAGPDGVGILWDLGGPGRGVGGGALEAGCLHIEIVGCYTHRLPEGATLDVATGAAAAVLSAAGLAIDALTNHSQVVAPWNGWGWECPGACLKASWDWFADAVAARMAPPAGEASPPADLDALWRRAEVEMIPQNPAALLYRVGRARGLEPISREWSALGRVCQVWFDPARGMRHLLMHPLDGSAAATRWAEERVTVDSRAN
mgnify:CR=1 FL=1